MRQNEWTVTFVSNKTYKKKIKLKLKDLKCVNYVCLSKLKYITNQKKVVIK